MTVAASNAAARVDFIFIEHSLIAFQAPLIRLVKRAYKHRFRGFGTACPLAAPQEE
jgi:hypothetical protein